MRKWLLVMLAVTLTSSVWAGAVRATATSLPFAFGPAKSVICRGSSDVFGYVRPGLPVAQGDSRVFAFALPGEGVAEGSSRAFAFALPGSSLIEGSSPQFGYVLPGDVLTEASSSAFGYVLPGMTLAEGASAPAGFVPVGESVASASSSSVWYYPAGAVVASASSEPFGYGRPEDLLAGLFAGVARVGASADGEGVRVVLTNDVPVAISWPDNLGCVILDLNGRNLFGADGADGDRWTPGSAGGPALVIEASGSTGEPTQLIVVDSQPDESVDVRGGKGGDGYPPGKGGPWFWIDEAALDGVIVTAGVGASAADGADGVWVKLQEVLVDDKSLTSFDPFAKADYAGLLYDADGKFAGSFEATVKKATSKKDAAVTIKIVPVNGKKETIKGTIDANGNGLGGVAGLTFGANGVTGALAASQNAVAFTAEGVTDATKAKNKTPEAEFVNAFKGVVWSLVCVPEDVVSDFANGYAAFSVAMQSKGKVKIKGVLPNGTKVNVSSKIVVGVDECAIPIVFSKSQENFGFVFWVGKDGVPVGVGGDEKYIVWTGKDGARNAFEQKWGRFVVGDALKPVAVPIVSTAVGDVPESLSGVQTQFLPTFVPFEVAGTKWSFAKDPKIKFTKGVFDQTAFDKDIAAGKTNLSGMKLKVDKKSGMFSGSYTIYTLENGKLKKNKVTVNGVMIDGMGLGSGFIRKIGAVPVEIGNWDFGKD